MTHELYKIYRPDCWEDLIGQDEVVKAIQSKKQTPHCLLLTGPSGVGKTTIARVLKTELNCSDIDFREVNCADFRGIDTVRKIRSDISLAPLGGDCRMWVIDECHKLSNDAQNAFLKMFEDTPEHVYFVLCTTNPEKLIDTIKTRATKLQLKKIAIDKLCILVKEVAEEEDAPISDTVAELIAEAADGSAREALVLLEQVIDLDDEHEMIEVISSPTVKTKANELIGLLLRSKPKWSDVADYLQGVNEEPESIRWMMLTVAMNTMLKNHKLAPRCALILEAFGDNFFDSKKAGLTLACWDVVSSGG